MMNGKRILLFAFFFTVVSVSSAQIKFQRTYGIGLYNEGRSIKQTFDGGYIVAGSETDAGNGSSDVYLLKIDSLGNFVWNKTFGGSSIDRGYSVEQLSDSGYIVCGYTNSFGNGGYDGYLIRTDKNGDTLWTKTYGGVDWDFTNALRKTFDGGFVLAGNSYSFNGQSEPWIIKTDLYGNVQWIKIVNPGFNATISDVGETSDTGYAAIGYAWNNTSDSSDTYILRLNLVGDSLWQKRYGSTLRSEKGNAFLVRPDNSFVIVGGICDTLCDNYLLHVGANGDSLWTTFLSPSGNEIVTSIDTGLDGNFVITGYTTTFGAGGKDFFITKTDTGGNNMWGNTYGGNHDETAYCVRSTSDGGYIAVGTSNTFAPGLQSIYIVKTDSLRNTGVIHIDVKNKNAIHPKLIVFPIPGKEKITFQLDDNIVNTGIRFELYNMNGDIISNSTETSNPFQINSNKIPAGLYLYRIHSGVNVFTGKFIIE